MKNSLAFIILTATFTAAAAGSEPGWSTLTTTSDYTFDGQNKSYYEAKTKGGEDVGILVGRTTNTKTNDVTLEKWYVTMKDCAQKMGNLTSTKIDGAFINDNDFVLGSGTVASRIAGMICAIHDGDVAAARAKSL